jgi:hypothetical protein
LPSSVERNREKARVVCQPFDLTSSRKEERSGSGGRSRRAPIGVQEAGGSLHIAQKGRLPLQEGTRGRSLDVGGG